MAFLLMIGIARTNANCEIYDQVDSLIHEFSIFYKVAGCAEWQLTARQ